LIGHGDPASCVTDATLPIPYDDCDDGDIFNFPTNPEVCDNSDNDCDTVIDNEGSYSCSDCPTGYEVEEDDRTLCVNIDECVAETDDCDPVANCTDTEGSFACACPEGHDDVHGDATVCLASSAPVPPGPTKFSATVFIHDQYSYGSATREAQQVTLYYEDGEVGSLERTGQRWIRIDVPIQGDVLTEIHRYGDFNVEWRHWQGQCGSNDMPEVEFPQLHTPGGVGSPVDSNVTLLDGTSIPAEQLRQFDLDGGVTLIVDRATGQPVRATYIDSEASSSFREVRRQIDFTGAFDGSGAFDTNDVFRPAAWFVDGGSGSVCPDIDPTCYRADVIFLLDGSGSMSPFTTGGLSQFRWQIN
jgi:hypothetical protein